MKSTIIAQTHSVGAHVAVSTADIRPWHQLLQDRHASAQKGRIYRHRKGVVTENSPSELSHHLLTLAHNMPVADLILGSPHGPQPDLYTLNPDISRSSWWDSLEP